MKSMLFWKNSFILVLSATMLASCGVAQTGAVETLPSEYAGQVLAIDASTRSKNADTYVVADAGEIKFRGKTLVLDNSVDVVFYVDDAVNGVEEEGILVWKGSAPANYTVNNLGSNGTQISVSKLSYDETYKGYAYENVTAKEMTEYLYTVAYAKVGSDYTYSDPVKYSVLDYCKNKRSSKTGDDRSSLDVLIDDMLDYGTAAQKYFNYNTTRLANGNYYSITTSRGTLADGFTTGLYSSGETVNLNGVGWWLAAADNNTYNSISGSSTTMPDGDLTVYATAGLPSGSILNVNDGGVLNIVDGMTFSEIYAGSGSSVNITGGRVTDDIVAGGGSSFNISGGYIGTFEINIIDGTIDKYYSPFLLENGSSLTITDGKFDCKFIKYDDVTASVSLSGGYYRAPVNVSLIKSGYFITRSNVSDYYQIQPIEEDIFSI